MAPGESRPSSAYATLLDALIFLVLVSIAAALVFTTLSRSSSLRAAQELRSQRLDSAAIDALLVTRPDGRTVGERVVERLLAQYVDEKGWDPGLEGVINDTAARLLSPRDRFNLSAVWRPVPWAGPEYRFEVGPPVPTGATRVDRVRTMPVADGFRGLLEERVNKTAETFSASQSRLAASEMLNRAVEAVRLGLARVKIFYCERCNGYNTTAEDLERDLEDVVKSRTRVRLKPVGEDVFKVVVNDEWSISKEEIGRFPVVKDVNLQPGTWEVFEEVRALAADALEQRLKGLDPEAVKAVAMMWLQEEQLRPNRAQIVLALWR